jgi:chromosome segregation ATPase
VENMSSELEELKKRKTELENELQSLNIKEEILGKVTKTLEERLAVISEEKIDPRLELEELTVPLKNGLILENRVRLNGNVIFSWSYQKLP